MLLSELSHNKLVKTRGEILIYFLWLLLLGLIFFFWLGRIQESLLLSCKEKFLLLTPL